MAIAAVTTSYYSNSVFNQCCTTTSKVLYSNWVLLKGLVTPMLTYMNGDWVCKR